MTHDESAEYVLQPRLRAHRHDEDDLDEISRSTLLGHLVTHHGNLSSDHEDATYEDLMGTHDEEHGW